MGGRAQAELYDRTRISELLETYCRHVDAFEPEALAEVFTPDCQVSFGEVRLDGFDALVGFLRETLPRFAATNHRVYNLRVRLEAPDAAATECQVRAWHRFDGPRPDLVLHGHYSGRALRTPDGWRIAEHRGRLADKADKDRSPAPKPAP